MRVQGLFFGVWGCIFAEDATPVRLPLSKSYQHGAECLSICASAASRLQVYGVGPVDDDVLHDQRRGETLHAGQGGEHVVFEPRVRVEVCGAYP